MVDLGTSRLARVMRSGDDGSMMLGLLAAFMISAMVVTMLATVRVGQDRTSFDGRYLASAQGADAGVQDAMLQINKLPADSTATTLPGTSTIDGVEYQWTASRPAAGLEWTITSTGTAASARGETARTMVAKVKQAPLFPLAAFADTKIGFNGNNSAVSYPTTGFGVVGSNGNLDLKNNTVADGAVLYDFTASPDTGRCTGAPCSQTVPNTTPPQPKLSTVAEYLDIDSAVEQGGFIKTQIDACKAAAGGSLPLFKAASIAPRPDGEPYCFSSFHADSQNFQVLGTGPVRVFVEGDVTLGNKNHSNVNQDHPTQPNSIRLQIFSMGDSVGMYNQSNLVSAVYAPNATCGGVTSNAGSDFYGSLICNIIDNVGGWTFHYDTRLSAIGDGRYQLSEYNED